MEHINNAEELTASPDQPLPPQRLAGLYRGSRQTSHPLPPQQPSPGTRSSPNERVSPPGLVPKHLHDAFPTLLPESSRAAQARAELEKTRLLVQKCISIRRLQRKKIEKNIPTLEQSTSGRSPPSKKRRFTVQCQTPESTIQCDGRPHISSLPACIPPSRPLDTTPSRKPSEIVREDPSTCPRSILDSIPHELPGSVSRPKLVNPTNPLEQVRPPQTFVAPSPGHTVRQQPRSKAKKLSTKRVESQSKNPTLGKLPYLRRNRLTTQSNQRTRQLHKTFSLFQVKFESNDDDNGTNQNQKCCRWPLDSEDLEKIRNEISIIQTDYQILFFSLGDGFYPLGKNHQSASCPQDLNNNESSSSHPAVDFLRRRFKFWKPLDKYLSDKFVAEVTISSPSEFDPHQGREITIVISIYHRSCFRSALMNRLFQLNNPSERRDVEPTLGEHDELTTHVIENNLYDLETVRSSPYANELSRRPTLRSVKVPPKIGALHFQVRALNQCLFLYLTQVQILCPTL